MRLTTRDRALALASSIIEARADEVANVLANWHEKYPDDQLGAATERSAYLECKLLGRLVREKMSPAGRRSIEEGD